VKQAAVNLLRQTRLLPTVEAARYALSAIKSVYDNRAFRQEHPGLALPPWPLMHDAFSHVQYRSYFATGTAAARAIAGLAATFLGGRPVTVCEWGCGPGRVIRHLPGLLPKESKIFGTDYNPRSIEWCSANLPGKYFINKLAPPLPLEAEQVDMLYAISIFTHLSEGMHEEWLKELLRVVRPGGIILLTVHGDKCIGGLNAQERAAYHAGRLVVRGNVKEGSRIFVAYQSPRYMHETLLRGIEILAHNPEYLQAVAGAQDVYVLRRPESLR
jgi:SAM-dependent methyltransferase